MRKEAFVCLFVAVCLVLSSSAFGQTVSITGKVVAITSSVITVESGKDTWNINLRPTTTVKGESKIGATVTVTCKESDAQKKEITAPSGG